MLEQYAAGWVNKDIDAVVALVTEDVVVTESHGTTYRGADTVRQWMTAWFAAGGSVHDWQIVHSFVGPDVEIGEWRFSYTWLDNSDTLDGVSVAAISKGRIHSIREYQSTGVIRPWNGTW